MVVVNLNWLDALVDMVSKGQYGDAYKLGLSMWENNTAEYGMKIAHILAVCVIETGS